MLATLSLLIGVFGIIFYLCGPAASSSLDTNLSDAQKASIWYKGVFSYATAQKIPCSLLIIMLVSNFGTFLYNPIKHILIPGFGLIANLACMCFYLIGPFSVAGMSKAEPFWALGVSAAWGLYGLIYFLGRSKKLGRPVFVATPATTSANP